MRLLPADGPAELSFSIRWLTERGVVEYSAQDFIRDVETQKKAFSDLGVKARDKVGIRGENSYLWLVTDVALAELDAVSVVFPPEFSNHSDNALLSDYALRFMMVSDAGAPEASSNRSVAIMGKVDPTRHRIHDIKADPYPVTDDDHSFVFSSGTSGTFKGMVISKKGVLDQVETFGEALDVSESDRILLFMPFSSLQNRVLYYGAILRNVNMTAVPSTQLLDGLTRFQPTILIAPPIFYEAVEKSIKANLRGQGKAVHLVLRCISGIAQALQYLGQNALRQRILSRVYTKAHAVFGGKMRIMVTGMAKIGATTLEFYQSLGLPLVQVYGLTECGVVCANTLDDNEIGTVGKPLPGNTISISDDGEIVVRKSAPQTNRFFHFEASTEDTRFEDGQIFTGDLGQISESGALTLIGRKKSTIVGHTGVKVQPELIEKQLEENMLISKAVLVGLAEGRSLGVVLQPTKPLDSDTRDRLEKDAVTVVGDMAASFRNQLRIAFSPDEFTTENGFLTRNLKINRNAVRRHFFNDGQGHRMDSRADV